METLFNKLEKLIIKSPQFLTKLKEKIGKFKIIIMEENKTQTTLEKIMLVFISVIMTIFFVSFVFSAFIQNNKQDKTIELYQDIVDNCKMIQFNIANK